MIRFVILLSLLINGVFVFAQNETHTMGDEFLIKNQNECFVTRRLVSCIKYKMAQMFVKLASNSLRYLPHEDGRNLPSTRTFRFVHLQQPSDMILFMDSRSLDDDSEITKIFKFLKRITEKFSQNHGIQLRVSNDGGTQIRRDKEDNVVEPRTRTEKKKKKWLIILPLIILMKIAHLKMTVVPLLLGIIGLNVVLIGGGGWLIHYLKYKTLCKIHPQLVQSHSHVYDSDPSEYSAFLGSSGVSSGHNGGGYYTSSQDTSPYGKDWSTSRAFHAYSGYKT